MLPTLPPTFVPRPDALYSLRELVLSTSDSAQPIALSALHGLGGIGKTLLATALCHDSEIVARFPDGVVWIDVGRDTVNLTEKMKTLGMAFGDLAGFYTNAESAQNRLAELLAEKAVLVVLDDVWDSTHVQPFLVDAPRCRILFTTRDGRIADALSAAEMRLDVLHPDEALQVLTQFAEHTDPAFPQIAAKLGYLPLALKLVGASLQQSGQTGAEWLSNFHDLTQLHDDTPIDRYSSVKFSFDLSLQTLSETDKYRYGTLGIFPEDVLIPDFVLERLWRENPTGSLHHFERLALLDRREGGVRLHDLLRDYARLQLGEDYRATQQKLLEVYNPDKQHWANIPHDGYLYDHLAYHLLEAGQADELYTLLTESKAWREAKFAACIGDISFVKDLELAIRQFQDPLTPGELRTLVKLWAVRQVVNQQVNIYNEQDIETLVWIRHEKEAIAHAYLKFTPRDQFQYLFIIFETLWKRDGHYSTSLHDELIEFAWRDLTQWFFGNLIELFLKHDDFNYGMRLMEKIPIEDYCLYTLFDLYEYARLNNYPSEQIMAWLGQIQLDKTGCKSILQKIKNWQSENRFIIPQEILDYALDNIQNLSKHEPGFSLGFQAELHIYSIHRQIEIYYQDKQFDRAFAIIDTLPLWVKNFKDAFFVPQLVKLQRFAEAVALAPISSVDYMVQMGYLDEALAYANANNRKIILVLHMFKVGRDDQAWQLLKESNPNYIDIQMFTQIFVQERRLADLERLLEITSRHQPIREAIAEYYFLTGDIEQAFTLIPKPHPGKLHYIIIKLVEQGFYEKALVVLNHLEKNEDRIQVYHQLANIFACQNSPELAEHYLREIRLIKREYISGAINKIAQIFAPDMKLLRKLAELNNDYFFWKDLIRDFIQIDPENTLLYLNELDKYLAQEISMGKSAEWTNNPLIELAEYFILCGQTTHAKNIVTTIRQLDPKSYYLPAIAELWAKTGAFKEAHRVILKLRRHILLFNVLASVAESAVEHGKPAIAFYYLKQGIAIIKANPKKMDGSNVAVLLSQYLLLGNITEVVRALNRFNKYSRKYRITEMSEYLTYKGYFTLALLVADLADEGDWQPIKLGTISTLGKPENKEQCVPVLNAIELWLVNTRHDFEDRYALELATAWYKIGETTRAEVMLEAWLAATPPIPQTLEGYNSLGKSLRLLLLMQDFEQIDQILNKNPITLNYPSEWFDEISVHYAHKRQWVKAFTHTKVNEMNDFVSLLCDWFTEDKSIALSILQDVTQTAGWYDAGWREVHAVLVEASDNSRI